MKKCPVCNSSRFKQQLTGVPKDEVWFKCLKCGFENRRKKIKP